MVLNTIVEGTLHGLTASWKTEDAQGGARNVVSVRRKHTRCGSMMEAQKLVVKTQCSRARTHTVSIVDDGPGHRPYLTSLFPSAGS